MEQGLCARTAGENPREQAVNTAIIPLRCLKLLDEREKGAITSTESPDSRRRIKLFKLINPSCHYIPIFWKKTMGKIRPEDSHSARDAADGLAVPDRVIMVSAERGPALLWHSGISHQGCHEYSLKIGWKSKSSSRRIRQLPIDPRSYSRKLL
jgi:hypothetical protein